jgi:hypothetical protein
MKAIFESEVVRYVHPIIAGLMYVRSGDHSSIGRVVRTYLLYLLRLNYVKRIMDTQCGVVFTPRL